MDSFNKHFPNLAKDRKSHLSFSGGEVQDATQRRDILSSVASGGGGGNDGTSPPPEIGKIVVEIWCYLPEVYTFGAVSEIQEIFSKKL